MGYGEEQKGDEHFLFCSPQTVLEIDRLILPQDGQGRKGVAQILSSAGIPLDKLGTLCYNEQNEVGRQQNEIGGDWQQLH